MRRECSCNTETCLGCERRRTADLRAYDAAPASLRAWLRKQPQNIDADLFRRMAVDCGHGIEAVAAHFKRVQRQETAAWQSEIAA